MFLRNDENSHDDDTPVELTEVEENVLYELMEALGLIVSPEEAEVIERLFKIAEVDGADTLNEAKNIVRLNKQARLSALTGNAAITLARRANDPLYKKYEKAATMRRKMREAINRKYGSKAKTTAKALLANAGKKKNMVDVKSTGAFNQ